MNIVVIILILIVPLAGPGSLALVLAAAAAVTAYEGLDAHTVYSLTATIVGVELLYGLDIGVLSLSYVIAVFVFMLLRRVISIPPWIASRGWRPGDALRVLAVACVMYAIMASCGVIVGHTLYGYADVRARLETVFLARNMFWIPIALAAILIVLRRADEPFRRHITFGI